MLGLTTGIANLKPAAFKLVPKTIVTALPQSLLAIEKQLSEMLIMIDNVRSDGGIQRVENDLIIHSVAQQVHPSIDLKAYYKNADAQVDQALKGVHDILSIVKPESFDAFSGAVVGITSIQKQLDAALVDVAKLRKDAKAKSTNISTHAASAAKGLESLEASRATVEKEAAAFKDEAAGHAKSADLDKSKIMALLADIEAVKSRGDTLNAQVEALRPALESFQKQLDDRNSTFEKGKAEFEKLREDMLKASEKNAEYIEQSKEALGWNTANGLAYSFAVSAQELIWPLRISRFGFYFSIILLFGSAALAFNGFPLLRQFFEVPTFPKSSEGVDMALVAGLLSVFSIKVAVILPALLLVGFTSRRHRALFHQHQLYTYKKTIASALPGFKEHANTHREAMAAAAFARLLFNPQEDASRDLAIEAGGRGWLSKWLERAVSKGFKSAVETVNSITTAEK